MRLIFSLVLKLSKYGFVITQLAFSSKYSDSSRIPLYGMLTWRARLAEAHMLVHKALGDLARFLQKKHPRNLFNYAQKTSNIMKKGLGQMGFEPATTC